jgi:SAM-dependent methyltransferase
MSKVDLYSGEYSRFSEELQSAIRKETWGEEMGQSGWITTVEQDRMIELLGLKAGRTLLDVACGSGGPTLRIVEKTGASATGIDIHQDGIATASRQAEARGLAGRAKFQVCDASKPLPFGDGSFDAVMCIDAINHLPQREKVIGEWARVLKPGGRLLFADPIVLTGALTNEEIAIRSSIGFFLFVAPDYDDRVIAGAGLKLVVREDTTESVARLAGRWREARANREADLRKVEGDQKFEGLQRFLEVASRIARERQLSRFIYVAEK